MFVSKVLMHKVCQYEYKSNPPRSRTLEGTRKKLYPNCSSKKWLWHFLQELLRNHPLSLHVIIKAKKKNENGVCALLPIPAKKKKSNNNNLLKFINWNLSKTPPRQEITTPKLFFFWPASHGMFFFVCAIKLNMSKAPQSKPRIYSNFSSCYVYFLLPRRVGFFFVAGCICQCSIVINIPIQSVQFEMCQLPTFKGF